MFSLALPMSLYATKFYLWPYLFAVIAIPTLLAAWRLVSRFLFEGHEGLRTARHWEWRLAAAGTALTVIGLVAKGMPRSPVQEANLIDALMVYAYGSPALVPYIHLLLARGKAHAG